MSLNLNPWVALLVGILIGWILEWLFELWFFRRRRLECQRRLAEVEDRLRARDEELRRSKARADALEAQLRAAAAPPVAPTAAPAAAVAAPEVKAELPEVTVAAPSVEAERPEVAVAAPEVEAELPEVTVAAPEVKAELPEVAVAAPEVEAELPADDLTRIEGIGMVYAARLQAAGITTFAQLAEADDAHLAGIIQPPSWRKIEYASWREQARLLAAGAEEELQALQARRSVRQGAADDLTLIAGIGSKTAAALQEAGITTFEVLAEADPQRLEEITREAGLRGGNYEAWIAQARTIGRKRSQGIRELTGCPQDLAKVKGIGSVYETKLYEAGIGTFWELASADEEELRRIFGLKEFQKVDLAAIKANARRLAEETHTEGLGWSGTPPDDFESLEGIGPVFEGRLYEAGICTYEALANATVEQLAEICKAPAWRMPDYAGWIAQAKAMLEQKGR